MRLDCSGMEFEKLADLLEQGQFELLNLPVGDERKKPSDIRLVYMMTQRKAFWYSMRQCLQEITCRITREN